MDSLVRDGWAVAAAMMSAVLAIGIALAFLESQWGAISGRAGMLAQAFDKIAFLAACGLVVVAATLSTSMLQSALAAAMGGSGGAAITAGVTSVNSTMTMTSTRTILSDMGNAPMRLTGRAGCRL